MSALDFGFLANDNLPSRETIVAMCQEAGDVEMAEALTQDWVAKFLNANPGAGCIVMEYIDAPDCDEADDQLVARAVQTLISIPGPTSIPGPIGGGHVIHNFFMEWTSAITYDTVEELQQHMNGVWERQFLVRLDDLQPRQILKHMGDTRRVNLVADSRAGLRLCPSDVYLGNFKKCPDGMVVALDFHATCFLPPSFFAVAMEKANGMFAWKVAKLVSYSRSSDFEAMAAASYHLVPYGRNDIGQPDSFPFHRVLTTGQEFPELATSAGALAH